MIIIAGLGNPEREYKNTRHNIGFETLNKFSYDHGIDFNKLKFRSHVAEGIVYGKKLVLIKPQTYMNLSGEAVRDFLNFYKLPAENLIVVYDDTSLDVGEIRIRKQGSAGGHNGMKNIIYHLETDVFARIRVGIGKKPAGYDLKDYVLSRFANKEHDKVVEGITKASEAVEIMLKDSVDNAMNKFNKKIKPLDASTDTNSDANKQNKDAETPEEKNE